MSDQPTTPFQHELQQFQNKLGRMKQLLAEREGIKRYAGDDFTEQVLDDLRVRTKLELEKAIDEPYFGRMDFLDIQTNTPLALYIGKRGVMDDETKELLVIDWRAPISSLFYSAASDEDYASYESPEGRQEGEVLLKRNIVIRKQELQRVVDSYIKGIVNHAGADEFLLYKLSENKDNRLRDIVSTIQSEQNEIIRAPKDTALIIQGVAGSGKTTVALHRLAYLLYEYREQIHPERMMIFAPNLMFLDYISHVLPELGVGNIQQNTFNAWALSQLEDAPTLVSQRNLYHQWFEKNTGALAISHETSGRFKGSLTFKKILDQCLACLEEHYIPEQPFEAWEGKSLTQETLKEWYLVEYRSYPLLQRKERIIARIKRWIEIQQKEIGDKVIQKELKKKALQRLRTLTKQWLPLTPLSLYQSLFNGSQHSPSVFKQLSKEIPEQVVQASLTHFKHKMLEAADLSPLLYIRDYLLGIDKKEIFDHVVFDEAQDFSPFQIAVVKQRTKGQSFTILGDLAQGIHTYQGIFHWNEFEEVFEKEKVLTFQLTQSYRSTTEIIQFANQIIARANIPVALAKPVFRSGAEVTLIQTSENKLFAHLVKVIKSLESHYQSIAIITRTEKDAQALHREVSELGASIGLTVSLIDTDQQEYHGGISIAPVYLTKGLEFDVVLMHNVTAENYQENELHAKLLYVGCTRALHQLFVLYEGTPSPLLK